MYSVEHLQIESILFQLSIPSLYDNMTKTQQIIISIQISWQMQHSEVNIDS